MDTMEFDATLGGTESLPYSANSLKFAASRSVEIAAMTESILRPSKTKLVFQTLPVHMRRRVMSHNCKRLPQNLRQAHKEQLMKSGLPPKQKRPPRKYRRRPGNLLEAYNRRQKRNVWLETHIWHAKRFHMTERWSHRLAYAPCDKAFRACYRASSAHCLLQDISYYTPIQITGPIEDIKKMFSNITNSTCGLGITAKAYLSSNREGTIHIFEKASFPNGFIGKAQFLWTNSGSNHTLWLFTHPLQTKQVESLLTDFLGHNESIENYETPNKRSKLECYKKTIEIQVFAGSFNRFRLTGPNSHAVLVNSLKCVNELSNESNKWINQCTDDMYLKEKAEYWETIASVNCPSQLPPSIVVGLIVKDPRLMRPSYRTKAKYDNYKDINTESLIKIPLFASSSPIWNPNINEALKNGIMTNGQFIEHITKTQLVPGEIFKDDPALQNIPVVLIQRPGSQDSNFKKLGYGSGWDIIVPAGYGLPFWLTFIMFGARSGGLRETESLSFEMGECYLPPDSNAGKHEEERIALELKEKYFRLPPSKRVNYVKLGVNSPFICPWKVLLKDWSKHSVDEFFILRDRSKLTTLEDCINKKKCIPEIPNASSCLVAVYVHLTKGNLKKHALICLPEKVDVLSVKELFEPHHEDPNEKVRKLKRSEHIKNGKRMRRKRMNLKKGTVVPKQEKSKVEPSEYVKMMRELWLPSNVERVRNENSRQLLGYISQGAFSFTEAHSCGVGYIPYNAISYLINTGQNQVLVRNTTSRKYRLGKFVIVKNV